MSIPDMFVVRTSETISRTAGMARAFVHRRDIRFTTGTASIASRNELKANRVIGGGVQPSDD
jgi:hypothetical protein